MISVFISLCVLLMLLSVEII